MQIVARVKRGVEKRGGRRKEEKGEGKEGV